MKIEKNRHTKIQTLKERYENISDRQIDKEQDRRTDRKTDRQIGQ